MNSEKVAVISQCKQDFYFISSQLSSKGFDLTKYKNEDEFINIDTNLKIIDADLGHEQVKSIIAKIRSRFSKCQVGIILCLPKYRIENIIEYMDMGVDDYIVKPCTWQELYIRLSNKVKFMKAENEAKIKNMQFDALLNNTPYMAWFKDENNKYIKVNDEFKEHSGKTIEEISGRNDDYVWDGKLANKISEYDLEVMNKRKKLVFDEIIHGKKGCKHFNIYKAPVINEINDVVGTIGIARDITELKNIDAKFQIIMDNLPFLVWLSDIHGVYVNANQKFADYFNTTVDNLIGKTPSDLYSYEEADVIYKENEKVLKYKKPIKFEDIINTNKGLRYVEIYKTPVFDIDKKIIGITSALIDVTDLKNAQKEVKKQAMTDALTQIYNRRALYEYMKKEVCYSDIGMMLIDIDNFKEINDCYGHNFGDEVLIYLAKELQTICSDNFVCRLGGDEFLVIFKNIKDINIILEKAKEIVDKTNVNNNAEKIKSNVCSSIGIAIGDENDDINRLLMKVDIAMYKAKEVGKNQFIIYSKELEYDKNLNLCIEQDLREAILKDEVKLFYQPQYTIDRKIKGFEALFRWNNKKYSDIPVIKIIQIMERSDLIVDMGYYIMEKACRFSNKINNNREKKIMVSINISAVQIMQKDFIKNIKSIINNTGVCANSIGVEITETVLLENIEENTKKIKELKDMGILIFLDDFGTGYSSLNYLVKLPLSIIKVDKSFIKGMDFKKEYINLLQLIIESSHSLNLPIVAEGVETEEQFEILREMNIDYIQGYLLSKPIPESEAIKLIEV